MYINAQVIQKYVEYLKKKKKRVLIIILYRKNNFLFRHRFFNGIHENLKIHSLLISIQNINREITRSYYKFYFRKLFTFSK